MNSYGSRPVGGGRNVTDTISWHSNKGFTRKENLKHSKKLPILPICPQTSSTHPQPQPLFSACSGASEIKCF